MKQHSLVDELRSSRLKMIVAAVGLVVLLLLATTPIVEIVESSFLFYLMFWVSLTLSVNLIFGFTGYIPFGYFAFYGVGAYGAAIAYKQLGIPMLGAILVGGVAGIVLALLFLPMFRLEGIYFAIATFAAAWALRIGITLTPESITGGATGIYVAAAYDPLLTYYAMFAVTVAVIGASIWLARSRYGTMLRAMREDPVAAEMSGINRARIRSYVWLLSAFFPAVIGGIDTWNTTVVTPEGAFDVLLSIKPILYALFGGAGTVIGPLAGATSLYLIDDFIWQAVPLGSYLITGLVLMLVVLIFPRGLIGEFEYREGLLEQSPLNISNVLPERGDK